MSDLRESTARVFQAPIPGARRRFSRSPAYSDWARHIVCEYERTRYCDCCPGDEVTPPWHCGGHGEGPRGVGNRRVWGGMVRRVARMLAAGWRPTEVRDG